MNGRTTRIRRRGTCATGQDRPPDRIVWRLGLWAAVVLAVVAWSAPVSAQESPTLDTALQEWADSGTTSPVRVIVRTKPGTRNGVTRTLEGSGAPVHRQHTLLDGLTVTVTNTDLDALLNDPDVESLSIDALVFPTSVEATSGEVLRDTLGLVADGGVTSGGSAWAGAGVGIAIVDSGIEPSADLPASRISAFYDFTQGGAAAAPFDDFGHGTHVAGLIGGSSDASENFYEGPASAAHLIGLKVLDGDGAGYTSDVIAAIEFAVEYRDALGIDIMNLSLGHPVFEPSVTDPLVQAVDRAAAAGIVVVVSAGNYGQDPDTGETGYGGIASPGNASSAITVGAIDIVNTVTRSDDGVTDYSSRGPSLFDARAKPDLVAPGHRLVAAAARGGSLYEDHPELQVVWSNGQSNGDRPAQYFRLSGTSMSTAVTSGVVAVLLDASREANPDGPPLTPNAIKAILQYTALPLDGVDALTQGTGSLNAVGATRLAHAIDTSTEFADRHDRHRHAHLVAAARLGQPPRLGERHLLQ